MTIRRTTLSLPVLALLAAAATAATPPQHALEGLVTQGARPLGEVSVYAYEVARKTLREVTTDPGGRFAFAELPSGLYKLVAFKRGFVPTIAVLSRAADQGLQFVELDISVEETGQGAPPDDYWAVRESLPTDVLRDIELGRLAELTAGPKLVPVVGGSVTALAGVEGRGATAGQVAGASLDLAARVGRVDVGVEGRFWQLEPTRDASFGGGPSPESSAILGVQVSPAGAGTLRLDAERNRIGRGLAEELDPIAFERHRLSWSHDGSAGRSAVAAEYVDRGDLYVASGLGALALPFAERSWRLEGSWERELDDGGGFETRLRYIEHELAPNGTNAAISRQLELSGGSGWQASPTVLIEYGLFSRLADGSVSLAPRGSLVLQLDEHWQARATASGRVVDRSADDWVTAITTLSQATATDCDSGVDAQCARLTLSRGDELAATQFHLAAARREIGDLVRMTFDASQLEGLLLLPGDQIPEVEVGVLREIAPGIVARFRSTAGQGGGGRLATLGDAENRVQYLITSIETHFSRSETGVFLSFQDLEQGLRRASDDDTSSLRRLEVRVSQDLDGLLDLATDWVLHLGMELSQGRLPFTPVEVDPDTVRQRLTGGVALKF